MAANLMHPSAFQWTCAALTLAEVEGRKVLEAGSMNVNGSVRSYVESLDPASYTGIDFRDGAGVDKVMDAADMATLGPAGVVISNEMLEHAPDWQSAVRGMVDALAETGIIVITTRSAGFPVHGYPDDHWRYPIDSMRDILEAAGLEVSECIADWEQPGVFAKATKPEGWVWPLHYEKLWQLVPVGKP